MDESYSEAFHMLAQTYERTGRNELAQEALKRAGQRPAAAVPLFQTTKSGFLRLIAGADKRLADMLRDDALRAFKTAAPSQQSSH